MIAYLLFLHFIADFVLQSREMGKNKSQKFKVLMNHLLIQYAIFGVGLMIFYGPGPSVIFSFCNMLVHGVIDWFIWRFYKAFTWRQIRRGKRVSLLRRDEYEYWDDHWFYLTIGFDQLLHALTLVLLAKLLFN